MRTIFVFLLILAACAPVGGPTTAPGERPELVLQTHDSFAISEEVLASFEEEAGVTVSILHSGDAGRALNQAILTKENPTADLFFGVDNTFLSRALEADLFLAYRSPLLDAVPDRFELDPEHRVTPIDYGDVCLNYDKEFFAGSGLTVPRTLEDLTNPDYRGLLVAENPATSSPGLAFMLATIARFGDSGDYTWRDYWADLRANEVLITDGWEEAYYGAFSGGSGEGEHPLVVSYASSPPAEVFFAEPPPDEAPTGVVTDGCFRQIEFAGVLRGTQQEEAARAFIDFMLSLPFQEDIPLNMFVFPVNQEASLPEVFVEHTVIPEEPLELPAEEIGANRDRWVEEWTATVLR
ncbi:MAG: thiamine ABC transporter substrate-binding protein [Acidimicrobiia bacterium]